MKRSNFSTLLQLAYELRNEGYLREEDYERLIDLLEHLEALIERFRSLRELGGDAPPIRLNRLQRLVDEASIDVLEHILESIRRARS